MWAFTRLKVNTKNNYTVYEKSLRNRILLWLMNLSGVTPADIPYMLQQIDDEIKRRES